MSEAPSPNTALPVMVSDLPAPSTVAWVATVLAVSVVFSVKVSAPPYVCAPELVTVPVPSVVWPLMLRLLRPVTVSNALSPNTALPVTESDLPAPASVPWVATVLPVSVVFSVRLKAPP